MSEEYLTTILESVNKQIKEKLFVNTYLPLIFLPDHSVFNMRWINEVATNPHTAVDVLDDRNIKLYTIPPLRKAFNTDKLPNLRYELSQIELVGKSSGLLAQHMLIKSLSNVLDENDFKDNDSAKQWMTIFDRYNLSKYYTGNNTNGTNIIGQCASEISDTLFEDEEW